jgi:hypothetical protein
MANHKAGGHAMKTIGQVFDTWDAGVSHKPHMVAELAVYIQEAHHFGMPLLRNLACTLDSETKLPRQLSATFNKSWLPGQVICMPTMGLRSQRLLHPCPSIYPRNHLFLPIPEPANPK